MKIVAVEASKGGVGKTTTAVNLAAAAVRDGKKVLLVDCDPQGNSGVMLGQQDEIENNIMAVMDGIKKMDDVIVHNNYDIDLAPAPAQARFTEIEQQPDDLSRALAQVADRYDLCIIDLGPGFSALTINALVAAEWVLVPTQADVNAVKSVQDTDDLLKMARQANPNLQLLGVLLTRWRSRDRLQTAMADVFTAWNERGIRVLATKIQECTGLRQAAAAQQPIYNYAKSSVGAADYTALWEEIK